MDVKKILVINATAADSGGSLAILKQILYAINENDTWEYIVFISPSVTLECDKGNVSLMQIDGVKSFVKRFLWDSFGVSNWLKKHSIVPTASLSLQNTNFRTGYKIPNYIYLHQSIPFFKRKWSILKKKERILWFYKNIYPIFIQLFLNKSSIMFVQLEYIKQEVEKKFKINKDNIYVVKPFFESSQTIPTNIFNLENDKIYLFYPATGAFYKNHSVLIDAINNCNDPDRFIFYFTVGDDFMKNNEKSKLNMNDIGKVSFNTVVELYSKADALIFPSYIESYGLPLLEAASYGLPIIAADLPYAREVLKGYEGAKFVKFDAPTEWENAMKSLEKGKRYKNFHLSNNNSWNYMFQIINNHI